jgi:hypothetical protein
VAELDPDQEAALRRPRAAFGFIEVVEVVGHEADPDEDVDEAAEDSIVDSKERGDKSVVIGDARAPGGTLAVG